MVDELQLLARDIDAVSRLTGSFTLRSGQIATEYFDTYLFEAQPGLLLRVAQAMVPLLPAEVDLGDSSSAVCRSRLWSAS